MPQQREVSRGVLKKIINDPFDVVDEMLEGFIAASADLVRLAAPRVVARRTPAGPKVGFVVGGGSGHEPAFAGYVGVGFADAACVRERLRLAPSRRMPRGNPGREHGPWRDHELRELRRRCPQLRPCQAAR